ncbi:MAG: alpha/beta hydrolase [Rhizobiaceae bacterium]
MEPAREEFIEVGGARIAVLARSGRAPGAVWLGGYRSDMTGTKAAALDAWAGETGHAFLRHDYSGHGRSGGQFRDGTISRWVAESLAVFRRFAKGPQVLVGSSMGAWVALRMAAELRKARDERVTGMVLIAPAPDFTSELVEPRLTRAQKKQLREQGFFEEKSGYSDDANVYTAALIEDGRANLVMNAPIDTHCPVHILQGLADPDVPADHALKLASHLPADDVTVTLIPGGDHRLSRAEDIDLLLRTVDAMTKRGA